MERTELKQAITRDPSSVLERLKSSGEKEKTIQELWTLSLSSKEDRRVKKSARKALYILRSGGFDVDGLKPQPEQKHAAAKTEPTLHSALISVPDSRGDYMLMVALENPATLALDLFRFLVDRHRGIKRFDREQVSHRIMERMGRNPDVIEVPPHYGLFRLNRALEKTDRERVSGLDRLSGVLAAEAAQEAEHPVLESMGGSVSQLLRPGDENKLFKIQEVTRLTLPDEEVQEYKKKIEEARKSRLIVENKTPQEREKDIIEKFYKFYFTMEKRRDYREILLDTALYYLKNGEQDPARILVEYANRLLSPALSPSDHPLISYLVNRTFGQK
ncbi:MAG: hypothetical protein ACOC7U_04615 [Spirochaetota bacterium]